MKPGKIISEEGLTLASGQGMKVYKPYRGKEEDLKSNMMDLEMGYDLENDFILIKDGDIFHKFVYVGTETT